MAMGSSKRTLCTTCSDIPANFFTIKANDSESRLSELVAKPLAGTAENAARCPLCHLVWTALSSTGTRPEESSASSDMNITLQWSNEQPETLLVSMHGSEKARIHRVCDSFFEFTPSLQGKPFFKWVKFDRTAADALRNPEEVHPLISPEKYHHSPRRPVSAKHVNFDQIGAWLLACQKGHPMCHLQSCRPPAEHVSVRFVDVDQHCIVNGTTAQPYVALSYVWGQRGQTFQLRKNNIDHLGQFGALSNPDRKEDERLPSLLEDAMKLVRKIGMRYLWIDSICILQDDPDDVRQQVYQMDRIYSSATMTIIALSASSVSDNLPGVRRYTRHPLSTEAVIHGSRLFTTMDEDVWMTFRESTYASRGWTFQEHLLSTRRLYFTKHQVFWECVEECWSEDRVWGFYSERELDPIKGIISQPERTADLVEWFGYYESLVSSYTKRNLTDSRDILFAFAGISSRIANWCGTKLAAGLPLRPFFRALFFTPSGENVPQRRIIRDRNFPSWSWLGWKGPIRYDFMQRTDKRKDNFHLAGLVKSIRLVQLDADVYYPVTPYDPAGTFHGDAQDPTTACETERWVHENIQREDVPNLEDVQFLERRDGALRRVDWDPAAFFRLETRVGLSMLCSSVPLDHFNVLFDQTKPDTYMDPSETFFLTPFSTPSGERCGIICGIPDKEVLTRHKSAGHDLLLLAICFGITTVGVTGLPMVAEKTHYDKIAKENSTEAQSTCRESWCGCAVDLLLVVRDPEANTCERISIGKIHSNFWWEVAAPLERFCLV